MGGGGGGYDAGISFRELNRSYLMVNCHTIETGFYVVGTCVSVVGGNNLLYSHFMGTKNSTGLYCMCTNIC